MWFLRPAAFAGLIIVPMILALYLFKKKRHNISVSSTFLWNTAQLNSNAERSLQKLRKNLLMLLQLIAALFCVLAMTSPYIKAENDVNRYKLVIDNSLSMSAFEGDKTRLDMAKADAAALVRSARSGSVFSVVTLNSQQSPVVSNSGDKSYVIKQIEAIEQSYQSIDYDVMPSAEEGESLVIFSDTGFESDTVTSYTYGTAFNNCGIISLTASDDGKNTRVLGKVKNFGSQTVQNTVGIYADGKLYDSRDITLAPDETKDIVFTQLTSGAKEIKAQLQSSDNFTSDDTAYAVITSGSEKKVLVSGENAFFERALGVMPSVSVYKNQTGGTDKLSGYNLYIFNGSVPDELPTDGHIIIVNPDKNSLFDVGEEVIISSVKAKDSNEISLTNKPAFSVYKSKKITLPAWGSELVSSPETPLIFAGSTGKQKIAVIGFDLSNSDLPLKMDFPVLIYDIINSFFPDGAVEGGNIQCGVQTELNISPLAQEVNVVKPGGDTVKLAPPFPVQAFKADEPGIYYLEQKINGSSVYEPFGVNIAYSDEQYFNYETEGSVNEGGTTLLKYNYDIVWLCLLIALIVLICEFALFIYRHRNNFTITGAVLRGMVLILLATAIFKPEITLPSKGITTVFAVDISDSMEDNIASELDFINKALEYKPEDDYTAAVTFGRKGDIISSAADDTYKYSISSLSDGSATNIQSGAETAASLFKSGTGKRLVLLTDGSENEGDTAAYIRSLQNQGVQVKIVGFDNAPGAEVQLKSLDVPEYLISSQCSAEIVIESTAMEDVNITLYAGGKKVFEKTAQVNIGENRFAVNTDIEGSGNIEFKAVIEPAADKYYQNNTAYSHSYIKSAPAILLLEYNNSGSSVEQLLKSGGVRVDRLDIGAAPKSPDSLNKYEAVVMADCPYYEMSSEFVQALQSYVKNSAGGLLVTAGENSLALGGYKDTVLEDILPVNMNMSDEDNKKNTAIVMVVDRSGSMSSGNYGVSKLELVKEAMVRSVETLDSGDSVGVLAFDDSFKWISEPVKIDGNTENIKNSIYGINDGGGTSILPAFNEAVNALSAYDADSKHIILMTDGQGEDSGYDAVIARAATSGISVSTVAVGEDSATDLLKTIAEDAGGRYYYTDEFTDLPKIFERETALSNKKYINNEEFYPDVNGDFGILSGIENMPALGGYIASERKAAADVVLSHNNNEPVLAKWQYGLGHTAVFAADIDSQCSNFLSAQEGQSIIKNAVAAIMRTRSYGDVQTTLTRKNGKTIITAQTANDAVLGINATLEGEGYHSEPVFEQVSAGVFEAQVDLNEPGNYVLNLSMTGEGLSELAGSVISIPYSDEYDIDNLLGGAYNLEGLYAIAERTDSPDKIFTDYNEAVFDKLEISLLLIIAALVLLFAELVLRRFRPVIKIKKKEPVKEELKEEKTEIQAVKPEPEAEEKPHTATSTSSILLKNKQKRENK